MGGETPSVRLALTGKVSGNNLGDLRRQIEKARRLRREVVIDLSEVTLVDHQALEFLVALSREFVQLINCPVYIEPWLTRVGQAVSPPV